MKIVAVSDFHGQLINPPAGDILLIGGDICPLYNHQIWFQKAWINSTWRHWIKEQKPKYKKIIATFGNHDFVGHHKLEKEIPDCTFLIDEGITFEDLNIWGSPWQPVFHDWAFNLYEEDLAKKWNLIPSNTHILVLHCPPYSIMDKTVDGQLVGSKTLLNRIESLKELKLVIFGHIHCSYGHMKINNTMFANVSVCNEQYKVANEPFIFEI